MPESIPPAPGSAPPPLPRRRFWGCLIAAALVFVVALVLVVMSASIFVMPRAQVQVREPMPDSAEPPLPTEPPVPATPAMIPRATPPAVRLPAATPKPGPNPTALVDEELNRLEAGGLAFNAPPTMRLRETGRIQLLIQPGVAPSALSARVTAPGPVVTDTVSISKVMEATLAGGPAFAIDDSGAPKAQPVGASEPTEWNWLVTPLEPGQHQLHLTVNAVVTIDGIARSRVLARRDYAIDVSVPPPPPGRGAWPWLCAFAAAGLLVAGLGLRRWLRARRARQLAAVLDAGGAQVFVSYSRQDSDAVAPLVARLHERGIAIWMDTQNLEGGEMWAAAISAAIRQCKAVVLMASPAAIGSAFVKKEIALATAQARPVLPVLVRPCELPEEWQLATAGLQRIDIAQLSAAQGVAEILRALAHLGVAPTAPAPGPPDRAH